MIGWIFDVTLIGHIANSSIVSMVFQFLLTTGNVPLTFAQCVTDLEEVMQAVADAISPLQDETAGWDGYSVARLDGTEVSGFVALGTPTTGGITDSDPLPNQTAMVVRFNTGHSRRILKKFVPGFAESATGPSGNFSTATVAAVASAWSFLLLPVEATEASWQYMYKTDNPEITPEIVLPVSIAVQPVPMVQRRRRT